MRQNKQGLPYRSKRQLHGNSLDSQALYLTPKFNRIEFEPTSTEKKPTLHLRERERKSSANFNYEQVHRRNIARTTSFSYENAVRQPDIKKSMEEELRQTDDSVSPKQKRQAICIQHFRVIKLLGKGRHGTVYLAVHRETGFIGALKIFIKEQCQEKQQQIIREAKIQSFLSHTHIIKVYSIFSDKFNVYLFMELGSDGQLYDTFQKRKVFKEETISFICKSLLEGGEYLHQNNIIHRDIKPENIVLIHGFPKFCDFGESNFCARQKGQLRQTLCGTPLYLSPQILKGQKYNQKIDIWALGAMIYELFTGTNPFNIKNKDELTKIITDQFRMVNGSKQISNFLTHCLKKHAVERPSATKLLKHPFIRKWAELQTAQQLCQSITVSNL